MITHDIDSSLNPNSDSYWLTRHQTYWRGFFFFFFFFSEWLTLFCVRTWKWTQWLLCKKIILLRLCVYAWECDLFEKWRGDKMHSWSLMSDFVHCYLKGSENIDACFAVSWGSRSFWTFWFMYVCFFTGTSVENKKSKVLKCSVASFLKIPTETMTQTRDLLVFVIDFVLLQDLENWFRYKWRVSSSILMRAAFANKKMLHSIQTQDYVSFEESNRNFYCKISQ